MVPTQCYYLNCLTRESRVLSHDDEAKYRSIVIFVTLVVHKEITEITYRNFSPISELMP